MYGAPVIFRECGHVAPKEVVLVELYFALAEQRPVAYEPLDGVGLGRIYQVDGYPFLAPLAVDAVVLRHPNEPAAHVVVVLEVRLAFEQLAVRNRASLWARMASSMNWSLLKGRHLLSGLRASRCAMRRKFLPTLYHVWEGGFITEIQNILKKIIFGI